MRENPMRFIFPGRLNNYFRGVIYVDSLSDGKFKGIKIWQFTPNNPPHTYIFAESGEIKFDGDSETFSLKLHNGNAENFWSNSQPSSRKSPQIMSFGNVSLTLPAGGLLGTFRGHPKKLHHMALGELLSAKENLNAQGNTLSRKELEHGKTLINMQISTRIANAVGILAMALLAIPLGIKANRSDTAQNAAIALLLCLGYYFAMVIFSLLGEHTFLRPDILVWTPNVALMALGFLLFTRAARH
jgi:lipopolysaccharide export LptBFGC system permease protein LptF